MASNHHRTNQIVLSFALLLLLVSRTILCFEEPEEGEFMIERNLNKNSLQTSRSSSIDNNLSFLGSVKKLTKSFKKLVSAAGLIPVDQETGKELPEELDDGELEGSDHTSAWSYRDQLSWVREYPICQGKQMRQSPIDIVTDTVVLQPKAKLEFIDYDQEIGFQLKNTHHSVSVLPIAQAVPTVRASWLPTGQQDFELQEIHFHWGDGLNKGSEHEINDQRAAAEMHMVHYKRGLKKEDIGLQDNSVLVIGVLIESDIIEHNKLEGIVAKTTHVNGTDSEYTSDNEANLINLLPDHHQSFYFYQGSLTTPPCYETVTWVVMSEPVYMANSRVSAFFPSDSPDLHHKFSTTSTSTNLNLNYRLF